MVNSLNMKNPLISICLPTLNARRFLEPRMASIFAQTMRDWELIVCDSESVDGTWEFLCTAAAEDPRIKLFRVPRNGVYAGWNECLQRAEGEYIHIATADDTCAPDFLERLVTLLDIYQDCHLAVSQFAYTNEMGVEIQPSNRRKLDAVYGDFLEKEIRRSKEVELLIHFCLGGIPWVTAGALVFRRSLLKQTGMFLEDAGPHADMIWSAKCSLFSDTLSVPKVLATWRQCVGQASSQLFPQWSQLYLSLLESVIYENEAGFPEKWRSHPQWRDILMRSARFSRLRSYRLDRITLRNAPLTFATEAFHALFREPRYFARRLCAGLTWNSPEYESEFDYFWRIIQKWQIDWEPVTLDAVSLR